MPIYAKFNHDSRSDKGYGRVTPRTLNPRSKGSHYPYVEPDLHADDDVDVDDESLEAVGSKVDTANYIQTDPYADAKISPFYYVAGNTKLSDCFFRTDKVLLEIEAMSNSMYSMPTMYKGHNVMFGGSNGHTQHLTTQPMHRTGDVYGWTRLRGRFLPDDEVDHEVPVDDDDVDATNTLKDLIDLINIRDE
jgi:hypothetical protein